MYSQSNLKGQYCIIIKGYLINYYFHHHPHPIKEDYGLNSLIHTPSRYKKRSDQQSIPHLLQ